MAANCSNMPRAKKVITRVGIYKLEKLPHADNIYRFLCATLAARLAKYLCRYASIDISSFLRSPLNGGFCAADGDTGSTTGCCA